MVQPRIRSTVPLNSRGSWTMRRHAPALLDHHQIQQPIVDARAGRDPRAVAELRRVGDRHQDARARSTVRSPLVIRYVVGT